MSQRDEERESLFYAAYANVLDQIDIYRDEIRRIKAGQLWEGEQTLERIYRACGADAVQLLRTAPADIPELRRPRLLWHLFRLLAFLLAVGAVWALAEVFFTDQKPVLVCIALIFVVLTGMALRASRQVVQRLLYDITMEVYRPEDIAWTEAQKTLLPARLRQVLRPLCQTGAEGDYARGQLLCSCGCRRFTVYRHPARNYLKAVCGECGKEYTLFDDHLDAYHPDGAEQFYYKKDLQHAMCTRCKGTQGLVWLTVFADESRSFFLDELPDNLPEEGGLYVYQVAFVCADCGTPMGEGTYIWTDKEENEEEGP